MKDYYEILGVARDAKPGVIKIAFDGLMKKAAKLGDAERKAEERGLKEAYAVLSNPAKREDFDARLAEHEAIGGKASNTPLVAGIIVVALTAAGVGFFLKERSKARETARMEEQRAAEQAKARGGVSRASQSSERADAMRQRSEEARAAQREEARRTTERMRSMTPEERAAARAMSKPETLEEAEGKAKP